MKKIISLIISIAILSSMFIAPTFASNTGDIDWKALYEQKINEIKVEYAAGIRTNELYSIFGTLYFSVQDFNFDGVPELYHTVCSSFEAEYGTEKEYEEVYYIKDNSVKKAEIISEYELALLPLYRGKKSSGPNENDERRWQYVMRDTNTGEVCFIANDSHDYGMVECPSRTYLKILFDAGAGVLKTETLIRQEADSYSEEMNLSGYEYIGTDTYSDSFAEDRWKLNNWQPVYIASDISAPPAWAVGEVAGQIYSTDIRAYVNGVEVDSYNIGGRTAIVIEDILNETKGQYIYDNDTRTLKVLSFNREALAGRKNYTETNPGSVVGNIYKTDIKTVISGVVVPSYNIGGKTAVVIEDLGFDEEFSPIGGKYIWDGASRTISLEFVARHTPIKDEEWVSGYVGILNEYKKCVYENVVDGNIDYSWMLIGELVGANADKYDIDDFGYAIKDINNNGKAELILYIKPSVYKMGIIAVYSLTGGTPYQLAYSASRAPYTIRADGAIVAESGGSMDWECCAYKLENDDITLTMMELFGQESGYHNNGVLKWYRDFGNGRKYVEKSEIDDYQFMNVASEYMDLKFNPISTFDK